MVAAPEDAETSFRLSGKTIEGQSQDNLVWKAYLILQKRFPERVKSINIHLIKTIPMGAGLGGGSADATFLLMLLNQFFQLDLSNQALAELALELGSDCPFFVENTPQFAMGRGEILSPVNIDLSNYSIQLICPKVHVATATAFANISPKSAPFDLRTLPDFPVKEWGNLIHNDFEQSVFPAHPELGAIKQQLYREGALFASMSGSGSAVFGIFDEGQKAAMETDMNREVFYFE